jgi:rare lipoprotein A
VYAIRKHAATTLGLVCALVAFAVPPCAVAAPAGSVTQQTATARARLGAMQKELGATMSAYDAAASQLSKTRSEVAANRRRLEDIKKTISKGQHHLASEAVFLYRTNGNGFTEALLSAGTFEAFATRLFSLTRLATRDAELLRQIRRDRVEARQLASVLEERERKQTQQVAQVSEKRKKAAGALAAQQAYADSMSAKVSKTLNTEQSSSRSGGGGSPNPPSGGSHSVARAKVEGRSGTYAVLASDPKSYAPSGLKFTGKATWYGNVRPNMKTASGRAFNENEFTCAHKTLPFGTRVAVIFRGKRVIVTVTDRGPYGKGRVIDVTKRAASALGLRSAGVGQVRCEVVRAQ